MTASVSVACRPVARLGRAGTRTVIAPGIAGGRGLGFNGARPSAATIRTEFALEGGST